MRLTIENDFLARFFDDYRSSELKDSPQLRDFVVRSLHNWNFSWQGKQSRDAWDAGKALQPSATKLRKALSNLEERHTDSLESLILNDVARRYGVDPTYATDYLFSVLTALELYSEHLEIQEVPRTSDHRSTAQKLDFLDWSLVSWQKCVGEPAKTNAETDAFFIAYSIIYQLLTEKGDEISITMVRKQRKKLDNGYRII
ncbi:hypothetical protein [Salinicola sp. MIT1003]|uniref:hypothetical protein n=1 Tax=Salinicola sp. MIT1003 TaxID=1882734 RepID=UPI0008DE86D5|nr:hypothetical protein [Salinicola sp. MIT1003]OHZ02874.1 hypothetical protein BC443_14320 [Salinicola sp. MIT1003]